MLGIDLKVLVLNICSVISGAKDVTPEQASFFPVTKSNKYETGLIVLTALYWAKVSRPIHERPGSMGLSSMKQIK
jgi:hypothetical protein